jgi:hypothetical protein
MGSTDGIGLPARPAERSSRELRKFGLVMAGALGALGGLAAWRGRSVGFALLGVAAAFLVFGLASPRLLGPLEKAWMAVARLMGIVMTHVILTLFYYLVITPFGIAMRIAGRDALRLRAAPARESFWEPLDPEGSASRPDKPY